MDTKGRLSLALVGSTTPPSNCLGVGASKTLAGAVTRNPAELHVSNHLLKLFDVFYVFGCLLDLAKGASLTIDSLLLLFHALGEPCQV
jgi:hypothetical protein